MNYLIALGLLALAGGTAWLAVKAKKSAAELKKLPEIDIDEAKVGDVGKFVGTLGGKKIDVPYFDEPVVYYSFKLMREVRKPDAQGKMKVSWKLINDRDSKESFELKGNKKSLKINPGKIGISTVELYAGKAVGLNKEMLEAMKFLTGATKRFDLGKAPMKLNLRGLPHGKRVLGVGKVVKAGDGLALVRDDKVGFLYASDDTGAASAKEKRNSIVFWVISGASAIAAIVSVFSGGGN